MKFEISGTGKGQDVTIKFHKKRTRVKETTWDGKTNIYPISWWKAGWYNFNGWLSEGKNHLILAMCLVFFVTGIGTSLYLTRDTLENRLYDRYYCPFEKNSLFLINSEEFNEAKKRYEKGDAEAAWLIMKNLPDSYSIQKELVLYEALSLMHTKHYQEAIRYFDTLLVLPDNQNFIVRAKWYQGLCFLKTKNIEAAKTDFNCITPLYPEEYRKAQKILKWLEKKDKKRLPQRP
jgi:tetratricopeptide (TPR) repeat protein